MASPPKTAATSIRTPGQRILASPRLADIESAAFGSIPRPAQAQNHTHTHAHTTPFSSPPLPHEQPAAPLPASSQSRLNSRHPPRSPSLPGLFDSHPPADDGWPHPSADRRRRPEPAAPAAAAAAPPPTEEGSPAAPAPPFPFRPLFTVVRDEASGSYYRPVIHYLFSDDDPELAVAAALRSTGVEHLYPPPELDGGGGGAGSFNSQDGPGRSWSDQGPPPGRAQAEEYISPLPLAPDGARDVIMLVDISEDGKSVTDIKSFAPDWAVISASISRAPTLDSPGEEDTPSSLAASAVAAAGADAGHGHGHASGTVAASSTSASVVQAAQPPPAWPTSAAGSTSNPAAQARMADDRRASVSSVSAPRQGGNGGGGGGPAAYADDTSADGLWISEHMLTIRGASVGSLTSMTLFANAPGGGAAASGGHAPVNTQFDPFVDDVPDERAILKAAVLAGGEKATLVDAIDSIIGTMDRQLEMLDALVPIPPIDQVFPPDVLDGIDLLDPPPPSIPGTGD